MFSQILPQKGSDSAGHCPTISKTIIQISGRKLIREMVKGVNLENCASSGKLLATLLSSCELRRISGCPFSPPEKVTILRISYNRSSKWPEQKLNPVRGVHARASGEAARRAKRGRQPSSSGAISHARGHLRVSRFARRTTEKKRLLIV